MVGHTMGSFEKTKWFQTICNWYPLMYKYYKNVIRVGKLKNKIQDI